MYNLSELDGYYKKFLENLSSWTPEGIYFINLELLHRFDLLHFQPNAEYKDPSLTRYFHIIESPEKVTLFNDEFVVWIIPDRANQIPLTYALIALNRGDQELQLEVTFIASGIYNSSKLVLKVLEKFLTEIQETEAMLSQFQKAG